MKTLQDKLNEIDARKAQGNWQIACGGTETPVTTRSGRRLQYVWQPSTGKHAYLDLGTDMLLTDEEAQQALGV